MTISPPATIKEIPMKSHRVLPLAVLGFFLLSACTADRDDAAGETGAAAATAGPPISAEAAATDDTATLVARAGAPLFEGMGDYHRTITTSDPGAQRYFDQGMVLAFGFNHAESVRSFRAAQRLDPGCAMCFWGEALATGPNINVTANGKTIMSAEDQVAAYAALERARALSGTGTEVEGELIAALAERYSPEPVEDRDPFDHSYASALSALHEKYPNDDDIAAMFAEAWMNTMPWDYWSDVETPRPETVPVIEALESTIARSPRHPLALHLYIHAVEASSNPGRAEKAADTLISLVPGSGHLVHMPAHIYWRVGRYNDASEANVLAAAVDESYIAQCNAQGFYPALYYPHNIHFLWAAASMEGRGAVALDAARKVAANVRLEQIEQFPTVEFFHTIPLLALVQFGRWDELLAEPAPRADLAFSNAIWHYARGVAHANKGDIAAARTAQAALAPLKTNDKVMFLDGNDYPASALIGIADALLQGEIDMADGDFDAAVEQFTVAVAGQDALPYMEPPFWYYPTRQSLGIALLRADRAAEAEEVYRRDLEIYPHNGWSTFGLIQALEAQGETEEAAMHREHFEAMWALADVELSASRIL
jgi:tetratricopeptide (TPR) repeat protein